MAVCVFVESTWHKETNMTSSPVNCLNPAHLVIWL